MKEVDGLKNDIRRYENYINNNLDRISELKKKYREGVEVQRKINNVSKGIENVENVRRTKMNEMKNIKNIAFIKSYVNSIDGILKSQKRTSANNDIKSAKNTIARKLEDIEDEIEDLTTENTRYRRKISDCKIEIKRLEKEEKEKR